LGVAVLALIYDFCNNVFCVPFLLQGPRFGLRLTLNVQKYENIPYSDLGVGVKARWYSL